MIVFLTDFGQKDFFLSQMKGAIFSQNSNAQILDLSNDIQPFNIKQGQYFLQFSYKYFPEKTVFCCVIDPGVGTSRKAIALNFENRWFIGPDNGLFSFANKGKVFEILYQNKNISNTFHGRDIFAPISAMVDKGNLNFLKPITGLENYSPLTIINMTGKHSAEILHIDRFGNLITNVSNTFFNQATFFVSNKKLNYFCETFKQSHKELFIIKGSCGLLEIVSNKQSAAKHTGLKINERIKVEIYEKKRI